MRIAILECGAVVVRQNGQDWLFGAPKGISEGLKEAAIEVPPVVFTTALRSPGYGTLGREVLRFKEMGFNANGMRATPISKKHGTDYAIKTDDGVILFSERGDVSVDDVKDYVLAITKNKHRPDGFTDNVITWPWKDSEYILKDGTVTPIIEEIRLKVWSSLDDVPSNLKKLNGTSLSLDQANFIVKVAKASADGPGENFAIGIAAFKKSFEQKDGKWVRVEKKAEKESVGFMMERLRNAFNTQFPMEDGIGSYVADYDPELNVAYLPYKGVDYEIPFTEILGEIEFANRSDWKKAARKWVTKVKQELRPKDVVNYRKPPNSETKTDIKLCDNCRWYSPGRYGCELVDGDIESKYVCDLWESHASGGKLATGEIRVVDKEITSTGQPIRKLGEIFTAAIHKAYNDMADAWLSLGYVDQDERIKIAGSIGKALKALRANFPDEVYNRIHPDDMIPNSLKELAPNVPDTIEDAWVSVYKSDDDWRWASISSVAIWDKQGELFTTKAMDWAVAFAKLTQNYGPLRYKHIPGMDGGDCDAMLRVGDFLFESGTFRDNSIGLAMRNKLKEDPGAWQMSVGLAYAKNDIKNGVYRRAAVFERSMTQRPALPFTTILEKR